MPLTVDEQIELKNLQNEFGGLTPDEVFEMQSLERELSSDPSFIDRMLETKAYAEGKAAELYNAQQSGEITYPEYAYRMAGQVGAPVIGAAPAALIGEGIELVGNIDKATGGYGGKALSSIAESRPAQYIANKLSPAVGATSTFAQEHPRLTGLADATLNIASVGIPAAKYGEDVIGGGVKTIKSLTKSDFKKMTAEQMRELGGKAFQQAEELGGGVSPEFWQNYILEAQKRITPKTDLGSAMKSAAGQGKVLDKVVNALGEIPDGGQSLRAIQEADSILGGLAEEAVDKFGKYTQEGKDYLTLQRTMREMVENAPDEMFTGAGKEAAEATKQARKIWAASNRMNDVEAIIKSADGVNNPSGVMRRGFARLARDEKRFKRFTPEEQFYIKKAAKNGKLQGFLEIGGSRLAPIGAGIVGAAGGYGTGGAYGATMGAVGGLSGGVGGAAAAQILREASEAAAKGIAKSRGEKVLNSITAGINGQDVPDAARYLRNAGEGLAKISVPQGYLEQQRQETLAEKARRILQKREGDQ